MTAAMETKLNIAQRRVLRTITQTTRTITNGQKETCESPTKTPEIDGNEHHESRTAEGSGSDMHIDEINNIASNFCFFFQSGATAQNLGKIEPWIAYVRRATHKAEDFIHYSGGEKSVADKRAK